MFTFLKTYIADNMTAAGDGQQALNTGSRKAGVAADPVGHVLVVL